MKSGLVKTKTTLRLYLTTVFNNSFALYLPYLNRSRSLMSLCSGQESKIMSQLIIDVFKVSKSSVKKHIVYYSLR